MTRPLPPHLDFDTPPCPICEASTFADDTQLRCGTCGVSWDADGTNPEWDDPTSPRCPSTDFNPWTKTEHRCILHAGHESREHGDGHVISWSDRTATPTPDAEPVRR